MTKAITRSFICFTMLFFMVTASFQSINAEDNKVTKEGDQNVLLFSNVVSQYTVRLPKVVDISNNSSSFEIEAKGDIAGTEVLTIEVPEDMKIYKQTNTYVEPEEPDSPSRPSRPSPDRPYWKKPKTDKECSKEYGEGWIFSEEQNACMFSGWVIVPTSAK